MQQPMRTPAPAPGAALVAPGSSARPLRTASLMLATDVVEEVHAYEQLEDRVRALLERHVVLAAAARVGVGRRVLGGQQQQQRSADWDALRRTRVGASQMGSVLGARARVFDYFQVCSGALDGVPAALREPLPEQAEAMAQGVALEPLVRAAYARCCGATSSVHEGEVFVPCTGDARIDDAFVASTDGRVGWHRLIEIKCPQHTLYESVPLQYVYQMQAQMAITGLPECDFVCVCCATRSASVTRVFFSAPLWSWMLERVLLFRQWCAERHFPHPPSFAFDAPPPPLSTVRLRRHVVDGARLWAAFAAQLGDRGQT